MDYKQEMENARCRLTESVAKWNLAQHEANMENERTANTECEEAKAAYNRASKMAFYELCFDTASPLLEAVKMLTYPGINYTDSVPKDSKIPERSVKETTQFVKLKELRKYASENIGREIGEDRNWAYMIEKFNQLMTFYAAQKLNIDPKTISDSYRISELAKAVDMGKTPTSNTQIQKQLQQIITAMVGEEGEEFKYNVLSHDVEYVKMTFAKASKTALSVKAKNPGDMYATIAQVCHRIVLNKNYKLEYYATKH